MRCNRFEKEFLADRLIPITGHRSVRSPTRFPIPIKLSGRVGFVLGGNRETRFAASQMT